MRYLLVLIIVSLTACKHPSTQRTRDESALTVASIEYNLVRTKLKIEGSLTLQACQVGQAVQAIGQYTITPIAAADTHYKYEDQKWKYVLDGAAIKSFAQNRTLSIARHEHGGLKSVGATSADRTFSIVESFIKLLPVFSADGGQSPQEKDTLCDSDTEKALKARNALRSQIESKMASIHNKSDKEAENKQIQAIAEAIARLETGPLNIRVTKTIDILENTSGLNEFVINWPASSFTKWSSVDPNSINSKDWAKGLGVNVCVAENVNKKTCNPAVDSPTQQGMPIVARCGDCAESIVTREPVPALVIVSAQKSGQYVDSAGRDLDTTKNLVLQRKVVPVPQWSDAEFFDLKVGLAEEVSVSAEFDEFGQQSTLSWTSNARLESIASGVQGSVSAYQVAKGTIDNKQLAQDLARSAELEAKQKRNKLEACAAIIESGGFICPE